MRRLNKKHINELKLMILSAQEWHRIYNMQDYQDLEPNQKRRGLQQASRWKKASNYFYNVLVPRAKAKK